MTARRPHRLLVALVIFTGLGVGDAGAQQPAAPPEPARPAPHDPLEGMEPSGRIPKVPFPEDLPNPERWRYFPEGRIKPGNVFQRLLVTSFISPQIFFEESVGVGGGIALTDIDFRNQRRREFLGAFLSYTTEGQQSYRAIWRRWLYHRELETGGVVLEERSFLDAFGGYRKTLTRRFFGLGPDTRPSAESSYTDEALGPGRPGRSRAADGRQRLGGELRPPRRAPQPEPRPGRAACRAPTTRSPTSSRTVTTGAR